MTYTVLAALGVALAVGCDLWIARTRLLRTQDFWLTYALLFVFQLATNGVLTGLQIVRYNPQAILGLRLAYAPVEDLAFGFALITITLTCWTRFAEPRRTVPPAAGAAPPATDIATQHADPQESHR